MFFQVVFWHSYLNFQECYFVTYDYERSSRQMMFEIQFLIGSDTLRFGVGEFRINDWVKLQFISFEGWIEGELFKSKIVGEVLQWDFNGEVSSTGGCFSWMRRCL